MARPTKSGIDYFPLDVETEDKIKLIEAKYGMTGFAVWIKLLQKIYKHGYYIDWTEEKILLFSNEVNVDINKVNEIINDCLKWEVFDKTLKEKYGILTSRGIQKRYFEATGRRKEVEVNENYLLVNGSCKKLNWVYVNKNKVNDNNNSINESKSTQSRVEDKRVEDNKKDIDKYADEISAVYETWIDLLSDVNNATLTKNQKETILTKLKKWSKEELIAAIENYNEIYRSEFYYSHSFTMYKFIKQKNGAPRFKEGLDQEYDGDIWKDYKNNKTNAGSNNYDPLADFK
jgi:hypothetical protein